MKSNNSKTIGGILGPAIIAMIISEFPLIQPNLYDAQIPPVVYLSGTLMFIAGLAIVRSHNIWNWRWTVLITVSAWFFLIVGLIRMFFASAYVQQSANTSALFFMIVEVLLLMIGTIITYKSYSKDRSLTS